MTVETQVKKVGPLPGNGATTEFSFSPMVIFESTDLLVVKTSADGTETTLAEGASSTTYSVSVAEYPGTGSITYPASGGTPLAAGEYVTIKRVLPIQQTTDLENQGGYFADIQETALDKLTMIALQLQEEIDRSVKVGISSDTDPDQLISDLQSNTATAVASASAAAASASEASTSASEAAVSAAEAAERELVIAVTDEEEPITTGTAKITFRMPFAMNVSAVRASLKTAQTSGNILTVDINEAGVSILSTKLTIDNTEKTSTTAATPAVISDTSLADDAEITIDVDQVGNGTAVGLKVTLIGTKA